MIHPNQELSMTQGQDMHEPSIKKGSLCNRPTNEEPISQKLNKNLLMQGPRKQLLQI